MQFYSTIKKNEILTFAAKWMELEIILLTKVSQSQKDKYCMFSFICGSKNAVDLNLKSSYHRLEMVIAGE